MQLLEASELEGEEVITKHFTLFKTLHCNYKKPKGYKMDCGLKHKKQNKTKTGCTTLLTFVTG